MEFQRTTDEFFMTDAQMAEAFGVSAKTVSRALDRLDSLGIIIRNTKTVSSKRVRTIKFNQEAVERLLKQ